MRTPKPPADRKKTVFIVDDHPLLREGLRRTIDQQSDLAVCGEAGNGQEALAAVEKLHPDLVLVDISLPGRDGIELTKELRARCPTLPVLVLSMHDESVYAERALRAGARGYVMKCEPMETHLDAIRKMLAGELAFSSHIVTGLIQRAAQSGSLSPMVLLSDRELEIFRLFGEGRTRVEIADNLRLSIKTIESHRANIRRKLGVRTAAELLQRAIEFVREEADGMPGR